MYYKIYFKNKPLFLTEDLETEIAPFAHHDDAVLIDEFSNQSVHTVLHEIKQEKVHAVIFQHSPLEELKKAIWKKFTIIQAAGGLVMDKEGKILMMYRRNKWDLPKGKVDEGENIPSAAIREVQEETGIAEVNCVEPLLITYHTYEDWGHPVLKETHWYLMYADSTQKLTPQLEEDISEVGFYDKSQIESHCKNTFPSILDVLKKKNII